MNLLLIFGCAMGAILIAGILFLTFAPDNSLFVFCMEWRYRALKQLRMWYLDGLSRTPPTSFEFFTSRVKNYVKDHGHSDQEREDVIKMLSREEFVRFYFTPKKQFSGIVFNGMFQDYRSGLYLTYNYDNETELRKSLPIEISSNTKALIDFTKIAEAGWFDTRTGQPTNNVDKQHVGRAIYWICKRNNLSNPAKIFAPFFNEPESKLRDWIRTNKNNEQITVAIDAEIDTILKK